MGESSMDAPMADNPMEDPDETGVTALQVSVSFGRFENDMLAWEKWSTFPTNKYLEEVEKCSTPGSVAQKKAYFEAHYKKIAARKAEQEDQDKKNEDGARDLVDPDDQVHRDLVAEFSEAEDVSNAEKLNDPNDVSGIGLEDEAANSASDISSDQADEPEVALDVATESNTSIPLIDAGKLSYHNSVSKLELENEVASSASKMSSDQADEMKDRLGMADERKDSMLLIDAEKLNDQNSVSGIELENEVASLAIELSNDQADEPKDSLDMVNESKELITLIDEVKDVSCCRLVNTELHEPKDSLYMINDNKDSIVLIDENMDESSSKMISSLESEEVALAKDKVAPAPGSEREEEMPQHIENVSKGKEEKVKSDKSLNSRKATIPKKVTNTAVVKKKSAASTTKSSLLSTPKSSRPALSKSTMSESRVSSKDHGATPLINKKPARAESRRAAPTSLHMSLSLGPDRAANSEPPPSKTMRKSVFMEKMGDKDIVKRVFKAFQSELNQLSSSSPGKPTSIPGIKASAVGTPPQKEVTGVNNLAKKTPQSSQSGLRKISYPTRSPHTAVGADQRNVKSVASNNGLKGHDKADKRKEFSKKLEEKANGKASERTQFQSKLKKEAEIKKLSHDHSMKARPTLGTAKPKSPLDKVHS